MGTEDALRPAGVDRLTQLRAENYGVPRNTKTVFLVGAGIAEGSWPPVLEALREADRENSGQVGKDQEAANLWFARWVWKRRFGWWFRYNKHSLIKKLEHKARRKRERELDKQLADLAREDLAIKTLIASKLNAAVEARNLRVRPRFIEIASEARWQPYYAVTTNWDRALEPHAQDRENMIWHLHGEAADPKTILLPDESIQEDYRGEERKYLSDRVNFCWKAIAAASELCIYGLSMSPLDADLGYIVGAGLSEHSAERPCTIHIFDLDCQLPSIERRMRLLLPEHASFPIEKTSVGTCPHRHH
jgi:hypothetical protein